MRAPQATMCRSSPCSEQYGCRAGAVDVAGAADLVAAPDASNPLRACFRTNGERRLTCSPFVIMLMAVANDDNTAVIDQLSDETSAFKPRLATSAPRPCSCNEPPARRLVVAALACLCAGPVRKPAQFLAHCQKDSARATGQPAHELVFVGNIQQSIHPARIRKSSPIWRRTV